MSFPAYEFYKDSEVEWLGEVPTNWDVRPIKSFSQLFGRIGFRGYTTADIVDEGDGAITLSPSNMTEAGMDFGKCTFISWDKYHESPEIKIRPHDLLMVKTGSTLGKVAHVPECKHDMTVNPQIVVFKRITCDPRFLFYFLSTPYIQSSVSVKNAGSSIPTITQESIGNFKVALPPEDEQKAISSFLDVETSKIDALVSEQRRLIELLKEKRQAVISHAVTKGLNPNAKMKPSGIQWLGEVPEHWEVGPLKRFWDVVDCKHVTVPFLEEGYPVASVMEVRTFELDLSRVLRTDEENYQLLIGGDRKPQKGDVIYCRNTANTGTSAYVGTDEPICIGQDVVLIKSRQQNGRFLNYTLHGPEMAGQLTQAMVGSTFKRINVADIRELIVTCPPTKEQNDIVAYMDAKTSHYDTLIAQAERAIKLLQERRTALISAAVTGKIDVRGYESNRTDS